MASQDIPMRKIYYILGGGLAVIFIVLLIGIMRNPSAVTTTVVRSSGSAMTCESSAVLSVSTATPYAGDTVSASYLFPSGIDTSNVNLLWNVSDGNPAQIIGTYAEKSRVSFTFSTAGTKTISVSESGASTYNPTDPSCSVTVSVAANTGACSDGGSIALSKRNALVGEVISASLPSTLATTSYSVNWNFQNGQVVSPTPSPTTGLASDLRTVYFTFSEIGTKTISAQIFPTGSFWSASDGLCTGSLSISEPPATSPILEKKNRSPLSL